MPMFQRWIFSLILICASPSFAMVIVGFDGEPFYFKNGSEGIAGVCHDLMQKFCDKENLHCKFKIAPLPVVLEMMKNGKADATCPLSETEERIKYITYTDKIFKTRFSFFGMPEIANKVNSLKDLSNLSVGVFSPSRASESLESILATAPAKFEVIKESSNVSTLLRAEKIAKVLAYMNHEIAARWIEKSHSSLIAAPLKGEVLSYNVGFSKKNFTEKKLDAFIKSVQEIKDSKEMKEAATKMGLTLWDTTPVKKEAVAETKASAAPAAPPLAPAIPLATAPPTGSEKEMAPNKKTEDPVSEN